MEYFQIATIQYNPVVGKKQTNLNRIQTLIEDAVKQRANIIILPEMCNIGYIFLKSSERQELIELSEQKMGATFEFFARLCKKYQIMIAYGFAEAYQNQYYNSQNLIDSQGKLIATYQKVNLFENDKVWAAESTTGYISIETEIGKIGLGICMDLNSKEFFKFHEVNQSQLYLISNHWLETEDNCLKFWLHQFHNANGIVAIANSFGEQRGYEFSGQSCCIEDGQLIASCYVKKQHVLVTSHQILT